MRTFNKIYFYFNKRKSRGILFPLFLIISLYGCSPKILKQQSHYQSQFYDTQIPKENVSEYLKQISSSVQLLNGIAYYSTYFFKYKSKISEVNVIKAVKEKKYFDAARTDKAASGSATIISANNFSVLFITSAHIVDFPDTIIKKYEFDDQSIPKYIYSISIKQEQHIYVMNLLQGEELKIIALNKKSDLALVGKKFEVNLEKIPNVFSFPLGDTEKLNWGTFVYVIGFPIFREMVTSGIVSIPVKNRTDFFYIDAVVNRGFSGGVVLALKNGVPNFRLVGIIKSTAVKTNLILSPDLKNEEKNLFENVPYKGKVFVKREYLPKYGITIVTSANTIKKFLLKHSRKLKSLGYDINDFLNKHKQY